MKKKKKKGEEKEGNRGTYTVHTERHCAQHWVSQRNKKKKQTAWGQVA